MTPEPYQLRRATLTDTQNIVTLLKESFLAAYPGLYRAADIEEYFMHNYTQDKVEGWLLSRSSFVWLACAENHLEGLFVFHERPSPLAPGLPAFEIDKLYLLPCAHGTGLAARFLKELGQEKQDIHHHWLLVAQKNLRAQRFYEKHTFKIMKDGPSLIVGKEHAPSFIMQRTIA